MSAPDDPPRFSGSWVVVIGVLAAIALLVLMVVPNFVGERPSKFISIVNTLRQIDAAKQQWAGEHGITNADHMLYVSDIAPYFRYGYIDWRGHGFDTNGYLHPVDEEEYVVNALGFSPEARFTKEFEERNLSKGTIIRFDTNGAIERIPPSAER